MGSSDTRGVEPQQVVFIDATVPDRRELLRGLAPGVEAFVLNPQRDGLREIAAILARHHLTDLSSISIVGHGSSGVIDVGGTTLDSADLSTYTTELAKIGAALAPGGDLQLYACDVAQGAAGDAFLQQLSQATGGANIAAASHVVGAAAEGGSWDLNVDVGTANVASPFTAAAVSAYPDVLANASNLVWYVTFSSTTSNTGVYTIDVNAGAAATNPTDVASTPSAPFVQLEGLAIDPSAGHYFVTNLALGTSEIMEGNTNGSGTPSVIYTSGNSGGDTIEGLAFDQQTGLLYFAVTDVNIPGTNTDTGIYKINALGTGTQTATKLVDLSGGANSPTDIAIDTTNNLLFYTNGFPGFSNVEEVGVANLTTGNIITSDLVTYSAGGSVLPYGIAVDPATDKLYWTTVNFSGNSGNAIYSATYSTGASVTLSDIQTLATTSQAQVPIGISLDVPAGGYYVDTSTGVSNDTTANEVLFGSSLTTPETLTDVYNVPDQDGGTETLPTEAIVVEVQPVVAASGTVTFVHGDAAVTLDSSATVSDADGYDLAGATVSIASGLQTGDVLAFDGGLSSETFADGDTITSSFSSGTLTLTGVATAANYQTALDSVTFSTTSTSATPRTIDWTVSDGVVTSPTTTSTVDVHVPPVVTAGGTATFDGGGSPVALDSGLVVTDASSTTLASATIVIVGSISADRLNFTTQNGISGSFNTTTGTLVLSGVASVANYQTALESITYSVSPSNSDPTGGGSDTTRTIDWSVNDGVLNSGTVTSTLDTVHVKPTITAGATGTFDGGGGAVVLDSGVAISDVDSGGVLASATVTIVGAITGDTLNFTNTNLTTEGNIAVASDSGGVLKLTSSGETATLAQWQTALESVTYSFSPSNGDPTGGGSDTSRTIDWVVNDGSTSNGISSTATSTLDTVHVRPTITTGGTVTFDGGGSPVALDSGLTVADADSGGVLSSATVTVGSGFASGDTLHFSNQNNITGSYDTSTGVLTLSGQATIANYQTALESITYSFSPTDGDPTGGNGDTSRTIDWVVNDGSTSNGVSNTGTSTLDTVHVRPTIASGGTVTFDGGGSPVALDSGLTVTDVDSGGVLSNATVTVGSGFLSGDILNFSNQNNITGSYDTSTGVLTLSGQASIANYQAALESITYSFSPTDGDPTDGGLDTTRTIDWVVNDGSNSNGASNTGTSTLDVEAGTPCYCPGTLIQTKRGQKKVEMLKIGDKVTTMSGAERPIKWLGRRSYSGRFVMGRKDILPVCIKAGALGDNVPKRDLWISPNHAMYLDGLLIEAKDLVNGVSIVQAESVEKVEYFHVELESHDVIIAEGALSESFIDDDSRGMFHNAYEYRSLYPGAATGLTQYCAPRYDDGFEVEAVRQRIARRAGLCSRNDAPRIGTLRGYVDLVSTECIAGWAQSTDYPEAPVCLDIYAGGQLIGQTLANRYRADLEQAGMGSGRHSFTFVPSPGLAFMPDAIEVRRSLDGEPLMLTADAWRATRAAA